MGKHKHWVPAAATIFLVLLAAVVPFRSLSAQGASLDKKTCKTVKKHGHNTKVCQNAFPKPTRTPSPTPTPTLPFTVQWHARPCTVIVTYPTSPTVLQPRCDDIGYSLAEDRSIITLTQTDQGQVVQVSRFMLGHAYDNASYTVDTYLKAIKSTPKDGSLTPWEPLTGDMQVTAANGHPYSSVSCGLPPFEEKDIYNGEWNDGWICSAAIDPHYVATTFTLSYMGTGSFGSPSTYIRYNIPLVDITVTPR